MMKIDWGAFIPSVLVGLVIGALCWAIPQGADTWVHWVSASVGFALAFGFCMYWSKAADGSDGMHSD